VVLKDAVIHSPIDHTKSIANYNVVKIGVREGAYTTWIGSWDQSQQKLDAATPISVLDRDRLGMRLKENQALVVNLSVTGGPESLDGSRVNFRMAQVGGHYDAAGPLVAGATRVQNLDTRSAMQAIERQVNGRLSEWEESVQLRDVNVQVIRGTFQGRLQVDSTTQISLQQYSGNWVEVDGEAVALGNFGYAITTSQGLLDSGGAITNTLPSASTLYYVYLNSNGIRLCATAPSYLDGIYYLGSGALTRTWRFCGWVYTDGSTQFVDSDIARHLVNYYNRLRKRLFVCPSYSDDEAETTWTETSTTWTKATGGSDVSFITNNEDTVWLTVVADVSISTNGNGGPGIGIDGITTVPVSGDVTLTANEEYSITLTYGYDAGNAGQHTASFVVRVSTGTLTIQADDERHGADADPAVSYLMGHLMA